MMSHDTELIKALNVLKLHGARCREAASQLTNGSLIKRVVKGHDYYYLISRKDGRRTTEYKGKLGPAALAQHQKEKAELSRLRQCIRRAERATKALEAVLEEDTTETSGGPPSARNADSKHQAGQASAPGPASIQSGRPPATASPHRCGRFAPPKRPLIALFGSFSRDICIELAQEWGWDLLDLELTEDTVPHGVMPVGILSDKLSDHPVVKGLLDNGCHAVRLGMRPNPLDESTPAVLPDIELAGKRAAQHFLDRGFKTVAHLGWDPEDPESLLNPLYTSFRRHAEAHGATVHVRAADQGELQTTNNGLSSYDYRTYGAGAWLDSLPKPVGVLAINDHYAASLCVLCRHIGTLVPEEVATLGVGNNISICSVTFPTLSSIAMAMSERARRGMLLMHNLITGRKVPRKAVIIPPVGVIERRSTDLLAVDNPAVAGALRFMWDNLQHDLSVDDIADTVGVGRRPLERGFRKELHRSIRSELERKRLEHCCHLLKATKLPVADIAPLSGFSSAGYLTKVFRRAFNTTPLRWRKESAPAS